MLSAIAHEINADINAVEEHKLFAIKAALKQMYSLPRDSVVLVSAYGGSIHHKLSESTTYRPVLERRLDDPDGTGVEILFFVEGHESWGPLTSDRFPGVRIGHPVDIGRVERWLLQRASVN